MKNNKTVTVKSYVRKVTPSKNIMVKTGYKGDYRFVPIKGVYLKALRFMKKLILSLLIALPIAFLLMQLFIYVNESANLQRELNNKQTELLELEETNKKLKEEMSKSMVKTPTNKDLVKSKIKQYFPNSHVTMTAIATAESHLNNEAMNWNCYYNKNRTVVYTERVEGAHSTSCKKEHRKYSWSIDCFVLMKNYIGIKDCPTDVTLDEHLKEMAELSKKRGYQPWSAYNSGAHEKYLTQK